jgi:hypothetical protein
MNFYFDKVRSNFARCGGLELIEETAALASNTDLKSLQKVLRSISWASRPVEILNAIKRSKISHDLKVKIVTTETKLNNFANNTTTFHPESDEKSVLAMLLFVYLSGVYDLLSFRS